MPHRCVHCSRFVESGSKEVLEGCNNCGGKFFFYVKDEHMPGKKEEEIIKEFDRVDKNQIEDDVRSILKIEDEDKPVVLDLENIRVIEPGKFEIDIVGLINRKPIIFKLEEGKYIIDISDL